MHYYYMHYLVYLCSPKAFHRALQSALLAAPTSCQALECLDAHDRSTRSNKGGPMPTHSSSSRDRHSSTYDTHEGSSQKHIRVGNINGTLQGILRWFANVLWTV